MGNLGGLIPVSIGKAEGIPWFALKKIPYRDVVLIATFTEQRDLEKLVASGHVKGIITELGGALSHEGVITREKGIPYLAGVREPQKLFKGAKYIALDTENITVLADGKNVISAEAETYNWLNLDIVGLRTIQFESRKYGLVVRILTDSVVVYSKVQDKIEAEVILDKVGRTSCLLVCDEFDKTQDMTNKAVINVINYDDAIAKFVQSMADAIRKFDAQAFEMAHLEARKITMQQFENTKASYAKYIADPTAKNFETALKSFTKANGYYKGTCIMAQYFEYALGSLISEKEARTVTDIELHTLRNEYENKMPNIKSVEKSIQGAIDKLDKELPAFGPGSSSLEGLYNLLMTDAQKILKEERIFSILFSCFETKECNSSRILRLR